MKTNSIPISLKLALWTAPAVLVFFLSVVSDAFNLTKLMLLLVLAGTAFVTFFFDLKSDRSSITDWRVNRNLLFLYTTFIGGVVILGYLATPNIIRYLWGTPGRANGVLYYFSIVLVALVILFMMRIDHLQYFIKLLWIGFIVLSAYSLIQFLGLDPIEWSNPYSPIIGTLGNPNFSAAALATGAIFFLSLILFRGQGISTSKDRTYLAYSLTLGLISAFLSWKTNSLQGPLIFATGIALIILVFVMQKISSATARIVIMISGVLLGAATLLSMAGFGPLGTQLEQYTLKLRGAYSSIGLKAMLKEPVHGYGVDSYVIAFREFRSPSFVKEYGTGTITNNAHSTPFQIGATFGVIVFFVYVVIQMLILVNAMRFLIQKIHSNNYQIKVIAILWVLIFAQSLLSIEQLGLGTLNWILGAVLLSQRNRNSKDGLLLVSNQNNQKKNQKKATVSKELSFLLLAFFMIPMTFLVRQDTAWRNLVALEVKGVGDRDFVEEQLLKMHSFVLSEPEKLGPILPKLQAVGISEKIGDLIRTSLEVNPRDVYAHELMSQWYRNQQKPQDEINELNKVLQLDPLNSATWLRKGELYSVLGDKENARESFLRAVEIAGNEDVVTRANKALETLG